ncbi:hypothetical protein C8Q72DRAFT_256564 [Fomitopsis betulina]|nr:hypothetical protein C8Q72DRAFT_256564 [Fomitopsis betulina]
MVARIVLILEQAVAPTCSLRALPFFISQDDKGFEGEFPTRASEAELRISLFAQSLTIAVPSRSHSTLAATRTTQARRARRQRARRANALHSGAADERVAGAGAATTSQEGVRTARADGKHADTSE